MSRYDYKCTLQKNFSKKVLVRSSKNTTKKVLPAKNWRLSSRKKAELFFVYSNAELSRRAEHPSNQICGFSDDRIILHNESKFTLTDYDGKPIESVSYDLIYPFENGKAVAMQGKEYVTIDKDGKVIGKAKVPQKMREIYYVDKKDEKNEKISLFGVQDVHGKHLTEPLFAFISSVEDDYNYATLADGSPVMISPDGEIRVHLPQDCEGAYKYDNCIVCRMPGQVCQIADLSGKPVSSHTVDAVGAFVDGKAPAVKDGKLGLISDKGEFLSDFTVSADAGDAQMVPYLWKNRIAYVRQGKLLLVDFCKDRNS